MDSDGAERKSMAFDKDGNTVKNSGKEANEGDFGQERFGGRMKSNERSWNVTSPEPEGGEGSYCRRKGNMKTVPTELIPSNAVDITSRKSGKLWKVPLFTGDENVTLLPRRGNLARIHYKCWLATDPEKKIFDSSGLSEGDDEPVTLNIGERQVIVAIDIGVGTMTKKGERALFISHFDLAYGRYSSSKFDTSNIPNESIVCVEIELVDIEDGTTLKNSYGTSVIREIVKMGYSNDDTNSVSFPLTTNSLMFIKLEGSKVAIEQNEEDQVFLQETLLPFTPSFNSWGFHESGKTQYPIPYCLGPLLRALRAEDKILFTLKGVSSFKEDLEVNGISIKAREPVKYLVEVVEVEEVYDPFLFSLKEKVDICEKLLERGVHYNSRGWYEAAACKFTRVREFLLDAKFYLKTVPDDLRRSVDHQLYFALCELAKLYWNLPEMSEKQALQHCNDAITVLEAMMDKEDDRNNLLRRFETTTDAYFLRARLYEECLKEYGLASEDFAKVVELTEKGMEALGGFFDKTMLLLEENNDNSSDEVADASRIPLEKMKALHSKAYMKYKETREMEKHAKKNYPFKYVPPK